MYQCVGLDIFTGDGNGSDSDDEGSDRDDIIVEFERKRWNLNASFRTSRDPDLQPERFHLINSRFLVDGIHASRWESYVKELKSLLEPRGWLQMVEAHMLFQSDSGREAVFLQRWWQWYERALYTMQKQPRIGQQLGNLMRHAGFDNVETSVHRLPIGGWMRGSFIFPAASS